MLLTDGQPPELESALFEVSRANDDSHGKNPRARRILALACLRAARYEPSIEHAEAAIDHGDLESINHLIIAVANSRLGRFEDTRKNLCSAQDSWPPALQEKDGYLATAPKGILWFETTGELSRLEREVLQSLRSNAP